MRDTSHNRLIAFLFECTALAFRVRAGRYWRTERDFLLARAQALVPDDEEARALAEAFARDIPRDPVAAAGALDAFVARRAAATDPSCPVEHDWQRRADLR